MLFFIGDKSKKPFAKNPRELGGARIQVIRYAVSLFRMLLLLVVMLLASCFFHRRQEQGIFRQGSYRTGRSPKCVSGDVPTSLGEGCHRRARMACVI